MAQRGSLIQTILVLDFGTSGARANLIAAENGVVLTSSSQSYRMLHPREGYAELDPEELWRSAVSCVRRVMEEKDEAAVLCAVSFSFFGDCLIAVDANGRPLTSCILCFDRRGTEEAEQLKNCLGSRRITELTGEVCCGFAASSKMLWLRQSEGEIFARAAGLWNNQQYILSRLGLPPVNDLTMASRKSMLDIRCGAWSPELLAAVGAERTQLGELVNSGTIIGTLERFGDVPLGGKVPVVVGGHDCDCGLLGLGVFQEDAPVLGEIAGTYDHIGYLAAGRGNIALKEAGFLSYCGPLPETTVHLSSFPTHGAALEWFMREIVRDTSQTAYAAMWDAMPEKITGSVRALPDFSSNMAAFSGLGLDTSRESMFQALVLALTFESRRIAEACCRHKRGGANTVRIGGGPSRSDRWMQLRADVLGMRFVRMHSKEISSVGAAVIAATAVGIYPKIAAAAEKMAAVCDEFAPSQERHAYYTEQYRNYLSGRNQA